MLKERYFQRLGLETLSSTKPTIETLTQIVEAHLNHIPFENLSQHGAKGVASLNIQETAEKIFDRNRGGFCFELNGLLAELLLELGYQVRRLLVFVCGADTPIPTHLVLLVTTTEEEEEEEEKECKDSSCSWFVDVGFGEPAIHPLKYEFDLEQTTPDGMISRFVSRTNKNDINSHFLEMWNEEQQLWKPRLDWEEDALLGMEPNDGSSGGGVPLQYFADALTLTQTSSIFCQKSITVKITRTEKVSMAGNVLKRTGPSRFGNDMVISRTEFETVDQVRQVLLDEFGITLEETKGLDLGNSIEAPASLWADM